VSERPSILVVDDDPHLREVVSFALEQAGFRVEQAENGREGLARVQRAVPALIVLDLMMPELDGLEMCREVRRAHEVPIVFLSSRDDEVDRILGLELGGDDYIRDTEGELIAQGAVVAELYRSLLHEQRPGEGYGVARSSPWPFPVTDGSSLRPILPTLSASRPGGPPE
jgi:two-component system OmpR family response regulator